MESKTASKKKQIWAKLPPTPPDVILLTWLRSIKDPRPNKVALAAGIYKDEKLQPFVIQPIKDYINEIIKSDDLTIFDPLPSWDDPRTADLLIREFLDPKDTSYQTAFDEGRVVRIPCQSGGNGLYFGLQLYRELEKYPTGDGPKPTVWVSEQSWPIHVQMFAFNHLNFRTYRYYDQTRNRLDFKGMMEDLEQMKPGDLLVIQNCGHNPTGIDPTPSEWDSIASVVEKTQPRVFFDFAYMGFASGDIASDSYSVNLFLRRKIPFLLTFSCAKNFGLYSLRVGFVLGVFQTKVEADHSRDFWGRLMRMTLGKPASFGQRIVREILSDPKKREHWYQAFKTMSGRLHSMRVAFRDTLKVLGSKVNWDSIVEQKGMFAYTGITPAEAERLEKEFGIYALSTGRISIAGLSSDNVRYTAEAFHEVTKDREVEPKK